MVRELTRFEGSLRVLSMAIFLLQGQGGLNFCAQSIEHEGKHHYKQTLATATQLKEQATPMLID